MIAVVLIMTRTYPFTQLDADCVAECVLAHFLVRPLPGTLHTDNSCPGLLAT